MNNKIKKEPEFWSVEEKERLTCTTLDEAVEEYLDGSDIPLDDPTINISVFGYARMQIPRETLDPLDRLLEVIDEEYGNPEETYEPTEEMREAEKVFIDAFLEEYEVWACEKVCEFTVNVKAWVEKNAPEWLEKKDDLGSKEAH